MEAALRRYILQQPTPLHRKSISDGIGGNMSKQQCILAVPAIRRHVSWEEGRRSPHSPWRRSLCCTAATGSGSSPISPSNEASRAPSLSGLVFAGAGSWDSWEVGSPVVKRFVRDDSEEWLMWYHGRSGEEEGESIGLAVSPDGIQWERAGDDGGSVMRRGGDWWAFDTAGVRPAEVVVMSSDKLRERSSIYWLYYTGFSAAAALRSLPGLAISQDGINWARIEGPHHSGALFGDPSLDSALSVSSPCVVLHRPGDLRMYYEANDLRTGRSALWLARSRDGVEWVPLGVVEIGGGGAPGEFDEYGAASPTVARDRTDGGYVMAYEGVDSRGRRSVGVARSEDGLKNWRRWDTSAASVLRPSETGGWDDGGVGSPCLVQMDGAEEWRLYYSGIGVGKRRIGLAILDADGFRRWGEFQLQQQT